MLDDPLTNRGNQDREFILSGIEERHLGVKGIYPRTQSVDQAE